jgi:hypothetical protein
MRIWLHGKYRAICERVYLTRSPFSALLRYRRINISRRYTSIRFFSTADSVNTQPSIIDRGVTSYRANARRARKKGDVRFSADSPRFSATRPAAGSEKCALACERRNNRVLPVELRETIVSACRELPLARVREVRRKFGN